MARARASSHPADRLPTVLHVARHAGVSAATVSRVLNGHPLVTADTRQRVMAAVEKLGYRFNIAARDLRKGRSNTVAFVVGDIRQSHYSETTRTVQLALEPLGVDLLLFNMDHRQERFAEFVQRARSMQLRAMIIGVSDTISAPVASGLQALVEGGTPVVAISQNLTRLGIRSLVHMERAAVTTSVEWLLSQGRRRIAFLGRIAHSVGSTERYRGYKAALDRAGRFDEQLVFEPSYRYSGGYETIRRALQAGLRFDALQTASDELAAGAIAALHDEGLAVPGDVAVIGIGDVELSSYVRPALSTLSSQHDAIARQVSAIVDDGSGPPAAELTLFRRELVLRGSTPAQA
jgi:DNA-binding LacI/PurR family transcriptional regulator